MEGATWIAVALSLVTVIKGIADSIMARLTTKDKLQQDVKVALLEIRLDHQAGDLKKCNEQHDEARTEIITLRKQLDHKISELTAEVRGESSISSNEQVSKGATTNSQPQPGSNQSPNPPRPPNGLMR